MRQDVCLEWCVLHTARACLSTELEDGVSMDNTCIALVASALIPTDTHGHYSEMETVDVQWSFQGLNTIFKLYNSSEGTVPGAYTQTLFLPAASLHIPMPPQTSSGPIIVERILEEICGYHSHHHSPRCNQETTKPQPSSMTLQSLMILWVFLILPSTFCSLMAIWKVQACKSIGWNCLHTLIYLRSMPCYG